MTKQVGDMKHGLSGTRPQMSIIPRAGLIYGGRATEYGADKYARGNFYGPPPAKLGEHAGAKRLLGYVDAAMRHLTHISDAINRALGTGGDIAAACAAVDDEASGNFPPSMLPHFSHALASLLIGVSCGVDDKLLPADPGQPWKALMAAELGLPQKDDPAAERARVAALRKVAQEPTIDGANARAQLSRQDALAARELAHAIARNTPGPDNRQAAPVATLLNVELQKLDREIEEGFAAATTTPDGRKGMRP